MIDTEKTKARTVTAGWTRIRISMSRPWSTTTTASWQRHRSPERDRDTAGCSHGCSLTVICTVSVSNAATGRPGYYPAVML